MKKFAGDHFPLLSILLLALVARVWGLDFGLPHTGCRPDESMVISTSLRFGSGDFNPHIFWYPSLFLYLLFALYAGYFAFGSIIGRFTSRSDFITEYAVNPSNFYLIDRLLSAGLGALTVFLVYKIAERLFDRRTALLSAFFLALAYLHVRDSHFGTVDTTMTCMIVCAVFFFIKCYEARTLKSYIIAGICAGLATSIKYNALLLILPFWVLHLFIISEEKSGGIRFIGDRRLIFFGLAFLIAFVLGTPFSVLDFRNFISAVWGTVAYLNRGHGILLGRGWWYHLTFSLFIGLGWSLLFTSLAGLVVAFRINPKKALLVFAFPLLYYLIVGKGYTVFLRYALPLVPFLCISAALLVNSLAKWATQRFKLNYVNAMAWGLAALIIWPSARRVAQFDSLLAREDNRLIATRWVYEHIPGGESVLQFAAVDWCNLELRPTPELLQRESEGQELSAPLQAKLDFLKRADLPGYRLWKYDPKARRLTNPDPEADSLPNYIIMQKTSIKLYANLDPDILALIRDKYWLFKSFDVLDLADRKNIFDPLDAFFVPFAGFSGVQRPGPNIEIYKKVTNQTDFLPPATDPVRTKKP